MHIECNRPFRQQTIRRIQCDRDTGFPTQIMVCICGCCGIRQKNLLCLWSKIWANMKVNWTLAGGAVHCSAVVCQTSFAFGAKEKATVNFSGVQPAARNWTCTRVRQTKSAKGTVFLETDKNTGCRCRPKQIYKWKVVLQTKEQNNRNARDLVLCLTTTSKRHKFVLGQSESTEAKVTLREHVNVAIHQMGLLLKNSQRLTEFRGGDPGLWCAKMIHWSLFIPAAGRKYSYLKGIVRACLLCCWLSTRDIWNVFWKVLPFELCWFLLPRGANFGTQLVSSMQCWPTCSLRLNQFPCAFSMKTNFMILYCKRTLFQLFVSTFFSVTEQRASNNLVSWDDISPRPKRPHASRQCTYTWSAVTHTVLQITRLFSPGF